MFWTNLNLIKFVLRLFFVFLHMLFSGLCFLVQMSPTKHSASKKSSKRPQTDSDNSISADADIGYNDCYRKATIIMERVVKLETLENLHT